MNLNLHFATCPTWETADPADCNCYLMETPWRIRKEPSEQFPWRVWRRTNDDSYEPLMRCSTFQGAVQLVRGLQELRLSALGKDSHA